MLWRCLIMIDDFGSASKRGELLKGLFIKAACIVGPMAMAVPFVAGAKDALSVKTEGGKVRGKAINGGKVHAWLGLPYAAPPIGDLRWKAPRPPAKWTGQRDAMKYAAHCVQNHVFDDMIFQDNGLSEDCLYLTRQSRNQTGEAMMPEWA